MENKYGMLLTPDIKLQRKYFEEMAHMLGIKVKIKNPSKNNKHYSDHGELQTNKVYDPEFETFGIYEENLTQRTSRKLGWNAELDEQATVLYVSYDTPGVQVGTLITLPTGTDFGQDRVFRVDEMSIISIYPASIALRLAPEWEDTMPLSEVHDFKQTNFNLLREETEWTRK